MTARTVLPLILVFAAGLAVGYGLGGSGAEKGAVVPPADPVAPPPRETPPDTPVPDAVVGPRAVPDEPEEPAAQEGTGKITGHVRSAQGDPLPGVVVRAEARPDPDPGSNRPWGPPPAEPDLETSLAKAESDWRFRRRTTREATTGADGGYVLEGLTARPHLLSAWADGWMIRRVEYSPWEVQPGATVDFKAEQVVALTVFVRAAYGDLPTPVRITAESAAGRETEEWRPEQPEIALSPGSWTLKVTAGESGELGSETFSVDLAVDRPPDPVTFVLESHPGITGRVISPSADEMQMYRVAAVRLRETQKPDPALLRQAERKAFVVPRIDSRFVFEDLEPGRWLVGVTQGVRDIVTSREVTVGAGVVEVDLEIPAIDEKDSFLVRVTDEAGQPEKRLKFTPGHSGATFHPHEDVRAEFQKDGAWRVQHRPLEEPPEKEGFWFVRIRSPRFGALWTVYEPGSGPAIELRVGDAARLTVALDRFAEAGWKGEVEVEVSPLLRGKPLRFLMPVLGEDLPPGSDGRVTFDPLAPGDYEVRAVLDCVARDDHVIGVERVKLTPGDNDLRLRVLQAGRLTVLTSGVREGGELKLVSVGRDEDSPIIRLKARVKSGRAEFHDLPSGRYRVVLRSPVSFGEITVDVNGETTARLETRTPNALLVTCMDRSGPAARAGLAEGDLIVGVDGTPFEDPAQMARAMIQAVIDEKVVLSVKRGRRSFEIEIAVPGGLASKESMGFEVEPAVR